MMKKVLIIMGLFLLSTIVYFFIGTMNLQGEFKDIILEHVENDRYEEAYGFHNSIYDKNLLLDTTSEDIVINAYNAINHYVVSVPKDEDDKNPFTYKIFEECFDVVLFNLPSTADLKDECIIELTFEGTDKVYKKELIQNSYELSVSITFGFMPVSIYQIDILKALEVTTVPNITGIKFIDAKEKEIVNISTDITPFSNSFFTSELVEYFNEYEHYVSGAFVEALGDISSKELEEKKLEEETRLKEELEEILENEMYSLNAFTQKDITSRSSYVIKNVILIGSILVVNGVIAYFVFIKNRNKAARPIVKLPTK